MNQYDENQEQHDAAEEIAKELREDQENYYRSEEEGWFYSDDEGESE